MARRGLQMRKHNDVSNKDNIARGVAENATNVHELTRNFGNITLMQRTEQSQTGAEKKDEIQQPAGDDDVQQKLSKVHQRVEERAEPRFFDRFLKSIGISWFSTSHDEGENAHSRGGIFRVRERSVPPTPRKEEVIVDYHGAGIFWRMDLDSAHSDFLVDIINYAFSRQIACYPSTTKADWHALGGYRAFALTNLFMADVFYSQRLPTEVLPLAAYLVAVTVSECHVSRYQLEDLSVAAVRLATKVESQHTLCEEITSEFDAKEVDALEIQICRATDFRFLLCSAIFFMRLVQKLVQQHSWQWKFAKFASHLALCQMELAMLKPPLLAGVVMRLTCLIAGDDSWTSDCYKVIGEESASYDFPQAILCRLILTARLCEEFHESYARYRDTVDHALSLRYDWIEKQAAAANGVKMLGNYIFG